MRRTEYPHGLLVLSGFSRRLVLRIERLFLDRNVGADGRVRAEAPLQHTISLPGARYATISVFTLS
jgi:hypothetical protein